MSQDQKITFEALRFQPDEVHECHRKAVEAMTDGPANANYTTLLAKEFDALLEKKLDALQQPAPPSKSPKPGR